MNFIWTPLNKTLPGLIFSPERRQQSVSSIHMNTVSLFPSPGLPSRCLLEQSRTFADISVSAASENAYTQEYTSI